MVVLSLWTSNPWWSFSPGPGYVDTLPDSWFCESPLIRSMAQVPEYKPWASLRFDYLGKWVNA